MNFKFTTKTTCIFLAGLAGGSAASVAFNSQLLGLSIVVMVVFYISKLPKKK